MGKKNGGKLHKIRVKGLRNVSLWVINLTNFCGGFSDNPPPQPQPYSPEIKKISKKEGVGTKCKIYTPGIIIIFVPDVVFMLCFLT